MGAPQADRVIPPRPLGSALPRPREATAGAGAICLCPLRLKHLAQRLKPCPVKRGRRRVRRRLRKSGHPAHWSGGAGGSVARGRTGLRGVEGREQVAVPDVHVMRRGHLAGRAPENHAQLPLRRGGEPGGRGREAQPLEEAEEYARSHASTRSGALSELADTALQQGVAERAGRGMTAAVAVAVAVRSEV
eukprot:CAMPEP_0185513880 /NCGR_PEP_ID=MMETSP1366-20130426/57871_1 /TAXON_ID=38817 /ORGANISM="Gephyrocapsa oceanica, Strain RCC1303" /LENGTH=189 /DNA_ID=CAMNT_0028124617 /DNA_START=91 /DNA_END=657 /DNA_ORIENTATION=-